MNPKMNVKDLVTTAMLAAISGALMSLEVSIPLMPPFYKLDYSDIPSIIALFSMGPLSCICVEVIKLFIKLFTVGTNSMYVGELANLIGILFFVLPVWLIYSKGGKTRKAAIISLCVSLPIRIAFACFTNACITLPLYAKAMGVSLDEVVRSVSFANPMIENLTTFIVLATIPFNLIKMGSNYVGGYLLYAVLNKLGILRKAE